MHAETFNTIKTSRHSSLKKYTSQFIWNGSKGLRKVLSVRGELKTEQNYNILTPHQLFWLQQHFFSVLLSCSTGGLGAQPQLGHGSHSSIFSPTDLNFLSPGLYNNSFERHICTQFNPSTVKVIPWSPDIFDRMHLLFTQVHFSSDSPAGSEVNMLPYLFELEWTRKSWQWLSQKQTPCSLNEPHVKKNPYWLQDPRTYNRSLFSKTKITLFLNDFPTNNRSLQSKKNPFIEWPSHI